MKTVLLCGGLGTRLREETEFKPKPMSDIGGKPILWHIMKHYAHHGLRDFVLCLGYKGHVIKDYFLNYEAMNNDFSIRLGQFKSIVYHGAHEEQDFAVTLADTGAETMTGGRIKRVARYLTDKTFLATYGDGVSDVDLQKLLAFHKSHGKLATVTTVQPQSRFGVLQLGENDRVERFNEKPQVEAWVSAGYFVFEREVLDLITGDDIALEKEPLDQLARDGQLMAYRHDGFFFAMDTFREYQLLNDLWNRNAAPWKVWR
jgi:glucose-1-phosphate cytidylyltransferase